MKDEGMEVVMMDDSEVVMPAVNSRQAYWHQHLIGQSHTCTHIFIYVYIQIYPYIYIGMYIYQHIYIYIFCFFVFFLFFPQR